MIRKPYFLTFFITLYIFSQDIFATQQIQNLGTIPSLDQVQQNLQQTRAVLEEAGQKVQELQWLF